MRKINVARPSIACRPNGQRANALPTELLYAIFVQYKVNTLTVL